MYLTNGRGEKKEQLLLKCGNEPENRIGPILIDGFQMFQNVQPLGFSFFLNLSCKQKRKYHYYNNCWDMWKPARE